MLTRILAITVLLFSFITGFSQDTGVAIKAGSNALMLANAISPDNQYILGHSGSGAAILWDREGNEVQSYPQTVNQKGIDRSLYPIVGHTIFSPDGKFILTGGANIAILWTLDGKEIQRYVGKGKIYAFQFSKTGDHILIGYWDGTARLWEKEGKLLTEFQTPSYDGSVSVGFFPDGQRIFTFCENIAQIWNWKAQELNRFKAKYASDMVLAPDGQTLASYRFNKGVTIWNANGEKLHRFKPFKSDVRNLIYSPDSKGVLVRDYENQVELFSLDGASQVALEDAKSILDVRPAIGSEGMAFSPDGQYILTHAKGSEIILWDRFGKLLRLVQRENRYIPELKLSRDGRHVIWGDPNHEVRLWDFLGHKNKWLLVDMPRPTVRRVDLFGFSPNGQYILGGTISSWRIWDLEGNELYRMHKKKRSGFIGMRVFFSPDGEYVIHTDLKRQKLIMYHISGKKLRRFNYPRRHKMTQFGFSPDGKQIFSLHGKSSGAKLRRYLLVQGIDKKKRSKIWLPMRNVTFVRWTPNGNLLCAIRQGEINSPGEVQIIDLNGQILKEFHIHANSIKFINFTQDGAFCLMGLPSGEAILFDHSWKPISIVSHGIGLSSGHYFPDKGLIKTGATDGTVKIWNAKNQELLTTHYSFPNKGNDWIIVNKDNYYMGSRSIRELVQFKRAFQAYNFEQFDLYYNRPDKVMESLLPNEIGDTSLIEKYRQAYQKRLQKYNFTEDMLSDDFHIPTCKISNRFELPFTTKESQVTLNIFANDSIRSLDRLNIFVNDVPIYGIQGINLRDQNTQKYTTTLEIPLSRGENKIQVSALNQGGAESLKATTYITYDAPEVKPNLHLITIGVSNYQAEGKDLQYAAKDAQDIADFYSNATSFNQIHTSTLTDAQVTKSNILALRNKLEQTNVDDQVLIYVSGHGLLDDNYDFYYGTHDIDFSNPGEKGILYDDIEGLLDGIPARKKLLLMDACHSGEYDADAAPMTQAQQDSLAAKGITFKGFAKGKDESAPILGLQNSFEMMKQLFADLRRGSGATVISSSSGLQFSYEDTEWENGAFTYVLLNGLKTMNADANGDGEITASEIQAYVGEFVPKLTEGLQVPTFRQENLEYDFRVW